MQDAGCVFMNIICHEKQNKLGNCIMCHVAVQETTGNNAKFAKLSSMLACARFIGGIQRDIRIQIFCFGGNLKKQFTIQRKKQSNQGNRSDKTRRFPTQTVMNSASFELLQ